ncbi:hypothetical protein [Micromonospora sp. NPDC005174]|uniref:hypothetical protein n=1 Tax=unclassified Micromonospora TaxID=2617518 RepID=UPI0033B9E428
MIGSRVVVAADGPGGRSCPHRRRMGRDRWGAQCGRTARTGTRCGRTTHVGDGQRIPEGATRLGHLWPRWVTDGRRHDGQARTADHAGPRPGIGPLP